MKNVNTDAILQNPFHDQLVTELIEDPTLYREMFSERILVGQTLDVFKRINVAVLGPQGTGKSMILNLVRYSTLSAWFGSGGLPGPLKNIPAFVGISINLVRSGFHNFGQRTISDVQGDATSSLDAFAALDYLTHFLFNEYLVALKFVYSAKGASFRKWIGISETVPKLVFEEIASWPCWAGYYRKYKSLDSLQKRASERLQHWRQFLNASTDGLPKELGSKTSGAEALHKMGELLCKLSAHKSGVPLFVVIDQYEVLPELNEKFGVQLQRIVNGLIKTRDPGFFIKIGARTHDWGQELRVFGSESRIELQRDYVQINLAQILMRPENPSSWLFPELVKDIAFRRMRKAWPTAQYDQIEKLFGDWSAETEARKYFARRDPTKTLLRRMPIDIKDQIVAICGKESALELRLAEAWVLQQVQRGLDRTEIIKQLSSKPWNHKWWRKERTGIALFQIASQANEQKRFFGWKTIVYLCGANVSAFLLLASEIWDTAAKMELDPRANIPIPEKMQAIGVLEASRKWLERDRNEGIGGRARYDRILRLGDAIRRSTIADLAISNPGHTGFSISEADLHSSDENIKVLEFLNKGVNWAMLEERRHVSKNKGSLRRKWYLHPLLSPVFNIPYIRVKEPLYVRASDLYAWLFLGKVFSFKPGSGRKKRDLSISVQSGNPVQHQLELF